MLLYVMLVVILILTFLYFFVSSNHNYFRKRGIPQTNPLFFYGDYKDAVLGKKHNGIVTKEIYDTYKHLPYVGFYMLNSPAVLVNDIELIKNVLIKDFAAFSNNTIEADPKEPTIYFNAFSAKGELWKKVRSYLTPTLTSSRIKTVFGSNFETISSNLIEYLNELCDKSTDPDIDPKEIGSYFTTDVITASTVGVQINSFKDRKSGFFQMTEGIVIPSYVSLYRLLLPLIHPFFGRFFTFKFIKDEQFKFIKAVTKDTMEHRRMPEQRGYDLISHLMSLQEKQSNEVITEDFIIGQVWSFYIDGFETSSTVILYALFELGIHLDVQEKLRREIDESCERNDGKITLDELINLKYLDMVVSETLRIHTPVLTMERECTKPYTFPPATPDSEPLNLTPGMAVVIPIYGLHMDEKYFSQPEQFNPENFSEEAVAGRPKCTYLPFGDGPRICIGSRLGLTQVKMVVATFVRNFEARTPSSVVHLGKSYDVSSFIKKPLKNIRIKIYKRKFNV